MKILFGVHYWGLGHATRDMVIIDRLLRLGHEIDIISTERALKILKERYKGRCRYFNVPDLYPLYKLKKFSNFIFTIHTSDLLKSLHDARKISKKIIKKGNYDKVIADGRMDVYDKIENSYLIHHQIRFNAYLLVANFTEKVFTQFYKHYRYLIVPDYEKNNLTGKLSHDPLFTEKKRIKYIGILSNIKKIPLKQDIDYFISLSGPEVARIELERKILEQAYQLKGRIVIAGGNPDSQKVLRRKNIKFYSYIDQKKQERLMNSAKFIIARGGYTTVMELAEIGKKNVLLIPSPLQSEQEYLADLYEKKHWFHHVHQDELDLAKDVAKARKFKGYKPEWRTKKSVDKFIKILMEY